MTKETFLEMLDTTLKNTKDIRRIVASSVQAREDGLQYLMNHCNVATDEMEEICEEFGNILIAVDEVERRIGFIRRHAEQEK